MLEPSTQASKRFIRDLNVQPVAQHPHAEYVKQCWFCEYLFHIEQEAVMTVLNVLGSALFSHHRWHAGVPIRGTCVLCDAVSKLEPLLTPCDDCGWAGGVHDPHVEH